MQRYLTAAILVAGLTGLAWADQVIWDNTGTASTLSIITVLDTAGVAGAKTSECADDFMLAAPMTVTRIVPQYFFAVSTIVDHWNIRIYNNNAGVPGTELLSTTAPGATYVASPPDQNLSLTLAQTFDAAASTNYWISLQPAFDQTQGTGVRWREIVATESSPLHGNVGYWRGTPIFGGLTLDWTWEPVGRKNSVPDTAEMLFTLYGVPEPAALGLLLLGGLALGRRR
jgi:hypothetical protein